MKFICVKEDLLEVVSACLKVVPSRSTQMILENIKIEATSALTLTAYDGTIGMEAHCLADVQEEGVLTLNAKILGDVLRRMPEGPLMLTQENESNESEVLISSGSTVYRLKSISAESFPQIPTIKQGDAVRRLTLLQTQLKAMIQKTIASVSTDTSRPNLNGALLHCSANAAEMVAVDGYRMALFRVEAEEDTAWPELRFIIPGRTLHQLSSLLADKGKVEISASEQHIYFDFPSMQLVSGLILGDFLDYQNFLPKQYQSVMKVETEALRMAFERAILMVSSDDNMRYPITLVSQDNVLTLKINSLRGSFVEDLDVEMEGDAIDLDFNTRFFIDALRGIDVERIRVEFTGSYGPCVIKPEEGDAFLYLLLPLRSR